MALKPLDPDCVRLLPDEVGLALPESQAARSSYKRRLRSFLVSSAAVELYSVVALSFFIPVTLEQYARDNGRSVLDHSQPCVEGSACEARILHRWINTASFSLFSFSCSVATLALLLISLGDYADSLQARTWADKSGG
jgi:UMF1 family MFS transporter